MTWLARLQRRTVLVNTTDGETFRGVLDDDPNEQHFCILISARLVQAEGVSSRLEGEVWIPREKVHFLQVLPAEVRDGDTPDG